MNFHVGASLIYDCFLYTPAQNEDLLHTYPAISPCPGIYTLLGLDSFHCKTDNKHCRYQNRFRDKLTGNETWQNNGEKR